MDFQHLLPFDTTYFRRQAEQGIVRPMGAVFEDIYKRGHWQGDTSVSGPGSGLEQTRALREALPALMGEYDIQVLLDLPCGDYGWLSQVPLPIAQYIGADIVALLIESNRKAYGDATHAFQILDLCSDPLPQADLLLCRDCLVNFSLEDIIRAINEQGTEGNGAFADKSLGLWSLAKLTPTELVD